MQPRKLNFYFAFFSYGGNGGISTSAPWLRSWFTRVVLSLKGDPRVGEICDGDYSDTPIDMMRNRCVLDARAVGADVLVMIDSDNTPDRYLETRAGAKAFIPSSFDFLYQHWDKGPVCIAAPYAGPPPGECVYIFRWRNRQSGHPNPDYQLQMYSREEAAEMSGIREAAALPTGVMMADIRVFDVTEPADKAERPWFYYEFTDKYCARKSSTEDVTFSRDLSMCGLETLKYNPLFCNWDAWAGHKKQKEVGPPEPMTLDQVNTHFRRAVERNRNAGEQIVVVGGHDFRPLRQRDEEAVERPLKVSLRTPEFIERQIGPYAVTSVGFNTERADLHALERLTAVAGRAAGRGGRLPLAILEIGSWVGETAMAMAHAGRPWAAFVTCVDQWGGPTADATGTIAEALGGWGVVEEWFRINTKPMGAFIDSFKMTGDEFAEKRPEDTYDLIFIDANHEYECVKRDIETWLPRVREHGIICGHDLTAAFPGVAQAVNECIARPNGRNAEDFRVSPGIWAARVRRKGGALCLSPVAFEEPTNGQQLAPEEEKTVAVS